jgi:hypothetical protein
MLSEVADWKHFLKDMARKESTVGSYFIQGWQFRLDQCENLLVDLKYRHDQTWTVGHKPYKKMILYDWTTPLFLQPPVALKEILGEDGGQRAVTDASKVRTNMKNFLNGMLGRLVSMENNGSFTKVKTPILLLILPLCCVASTARI